MLCCCTPVLSLRARLGEVLLLRMAPSKKKAAKGPPKADNVAAGSAASGSAAPSQVSSTRAASKQQPVQQPAVSSRPKRNAEKRFYDDIEDNRPQHLSTRGPKKKKGGVWTMIDKHAHGRGAAAAAASAATFVVVFVFSESLLWRCCLNVAWERRAMLLLLLLYYALLFLFRVWLYSLRRLWDHIKNHTIPLAQQTCPDDTHRHADYISIRIALSSTYVKRAPSIACPGHARSLD